MKKTLITLKPNLKTLIKIFILQLFFSCTTLELESVSIDIESSESIDQELVVGILPALEPQERTFEVSQERENATDEAELEHKIALLEYDFPEIDSVSNETEFVGSKDPDLIALDVVVRPKAVIVKKATKKVVPIKKDVTQTTATNKSSLVKKDSIVQQKQVIPEKKVVKIPVEKEEPKETIIEKPIVIGIPGKSFTVEMDQSGWIYENEIKGLKFKNKFYTSDRVLFEFQANSQGKYEILFTKYADGNKSITKVPVEITTSVVLNSEKTEVIKPDQTIKSISLKEELENKLENIDNHNNPDEVYFKLAGIYLEEGYIKKSKEFYEYIYDNYPLSSYYDESKVKMDYILDNFLLVR